MPIPGTTMDLSAGFHKNSWSLDVYVNNLFDKRGQISKYTECAVAVCAALAWSRSTRTGRCTP